MAQGKMVRWGILGAGVIARRFTSGVKDSRTGVLAAVGTRGEARVAELSAEYPGVKVHSSYEALLADPDVDAVYVATPHPAHLHWTIRVAEAGKHVLCEKPIAINAYEALAIVDAARKAGVFLMEAYMYRAHPQTARLLDVVKSGAIGEVRLIRGTYGFMSPHGNEHRHFAHDLAGGAILDVGGYPMSMARAVAGVALGKAGPAEPFKLAAQGRIGETRVDEWTVAVAEFERNIMAELSVAVRLAQPPSFFVYGTAGSIEVPSPWVAGGHDGGQSRIIVRRNGQSEEVIALDEPKHLFSFEVDAAGDAILAGRHEASFPAMNWADTVGNMHALDSWRKAIGLEYDFEKPAARTMPLDGRPLSKPAASMPKLKLPGVEKPAAAIAMGAAWIQNISHAALMHDRYFEAGGNFFDTAWTYQAGNADRTLGWWIHNRGVRDDVIILGKGAHAPNCFPAIIPVQLTESLDRLQTGFMDVYVMHRDNRSVPVGEFIDVLDREVKAGRIGTYGFSNWTMERATEALAYAKANGKVLPTVVSNNFSLAQMLEPVWPDCVSSSDATWRAWFKENNMTLFAWSSQARGFFTDRSAPDRKSDPALVRSWYSDENFARKERAAKLGRERGFNANQVALAYCLHQDFNLVPAIGPLVPTELEDSLGALKLRLTPAEVEWLRNG